MSTGIQSAEQLKVKLEAIERLARECLVAISDPTALPGPTPASDKGGGVPIGGTNQFRMNIKAFIKRYGKGMKGPQKFVLLLSHVAAGDTSKDVAGLELRKHWNKMTSKSLLGLEFHPNFPSRAIEYGWVNSRKRGFYNLEESWQGIFEQE